MDSSTEESEGDSPPREVKPAWSRTIPRPTESKRHAVVCPSRTLESEPGKERQSVATPTKSLPTSDIRWAVRSSSVLLLEFRNGPVFKILASCLVRSCVTMI